jgi:hypothetical protein
MERQGLRVEIKTVRRSQKTKNLCSEFGTEPSSLLDRETYGVKKYEGKPTS